jgi:hypothetical protein
MMDLARPQRREGLEEAIDLDRLGEMDLETGREGLATIVVPAQARERQGGSVSPLLGQEGS